MTRRAATAAVWLLALVVPVPDARADDGGSVDIDAIERDVAAAGARLKLVRDHVDRGEQTLLANARKTFSEAETQFLLDNFEGCAALLIDAIEVPAFREDPSYPQALYYLGESLYQTSSYLEARRYLREAANRLKPGRQHQNALVRLIDLADRTGDFTGIDDYYAAARRAGPLRPEVVYLYAKWTSRRGDLPAAERMRRADADFASLSPGQPFYPQAVYYRGAMKVAAAQVELSQARLLAAQVKDRQAPERQEALRARAGQLLDEAAQRFEEVLALPVSDPPDPTLERVRGLSNLALARVHYELGRYSEAVDRYQQVDRRSDEYNDALFETAATFVKMGRYEQALRTAEILLIIGKDSPVAPEAQLLQGNLELQLSRHDAAYETFADVVRKLSPVRDQILAVVQRPDPVAYFDELLKQREGALDIRTLLPKQAQSWVAVDREVNVARSIAGELHQGQVDIAESEQLIRKMLDVLTVARVNHFPQFQEGANLAVQVSNALTALEGQLVRLQMALLGDDLPEHLRRRLAQLEAERAELDLKFKNLPTTEAQYEARKDRFLKRVAELEEKSFDLRRQVEGMRAELVGLRKYWDDTKKQRRVSAAHEAERQSEFEQYLQLISQLDEARLEVNRQIATERATAFGQAVGGDLEEDLRVRYRQQLFEMQKIISEAKQNFGADRNARLARVDRSRVEIDRLHTELGGLRQRMREKAQLRATDYVARIKQEQQVLEEYARQIGAVENDTRHLVGEIAYGSFTRVGQQFHDLVLRGDVGIIDVAWGQKRERSDRISSLVQDRDKELRKLQSQFSEVLSDVD